MTTEKRPLKVFLCHAHADRDSVRGLYARLTQDGVDVWFDKAKLLPGQDWELEIRKAVREADVVVVCLSKQFNQAGFRQKEVRLALDTAMEKPEGEIFIIPARLEECDNLESLRKWHWVDLFEDDGYGMLMQALRVRANKIGATLQIKKNWLPKISSPSSSVAKSVEEKKSVIPDQNETTEETKNKEKRELARLLKKNERRFKREVLWIDVQGKLDLFLTELRYRLRLLRLNFLPILFLLMAVVVLVFLAFYLQRNIPRLTQVLIFTPQPSQISTDDFLSTNTPTLSPTENLKTFTPIPVMETPTLFLTDTQVVPSETRSSLGSEALSNDENLEFLDDFNGSTKFHFFSGEPEFKILEGGESVLHLGPASMGRKIFIYFGWVVPNENSQRGSEIIRMVFKADYEKNGFLSLQWGKSYPFKEIRIYPKTSVYALNDVTDSTTSQIKAGSIDCGDIHSWDDPTFLEINYKEDENTTTVQIDDCEPITFSMLGGFGDFFHLMPYDLKSVDLYYLLIASPK